MLNIKDLQRRLTSWGYVLTIDGQYGPQTRAAIMAAMTDPMDRAIGEQDVATLARDWAVEPAAVWAVRDVEASGAAFKDGRPTILFEPHRFSRATNHRFDKKYPTVSYRAWDPKKYPGNQKARWDQLLAAVELDVDAAFASASYGAFQILGENFAACGAADSVDFARAEAMGEDQQLLHFSRFVASAGLVPALRRHDWAAFARGYNGTAFKVNKYDEKLAKAFENRRGG